MRFPRPRLVTFDAFGTIYTPKGSVAHQYSSYVLNNHNIRVDPEQISSQFPSAFKQVEKEYPSYGQSQQLTISQWWKRVIKLAFEPIELPPSAIEGLYNHFNTRHAYDIHGDCVRLMTDLKTKNIPMGIISNSDPRLRDIINSMNLTSIIGGDERICLSYELGVEKPNLGIFEKAAEQLGINTKGNYNHVWHVGDDMVKDGQGAIDAGWSVILLDRDIKQTSIEKMDNGKVKVVVKSLDDAVDIFE